MFRSLAAWSRGGVHVSRLDAIRARGADAYGLVDSLPHGEERAAAWAAYALQTYGDKLVDACEQDGLIPLDTCRVAQAAFELAGGCLEVARRARSASLPRAFPHWRSAVRTREQLVGMRETLEDLRTHLAFELGTASERATASPFRERLAGIDAELTKVELLWIERPTPELRGGMGDALGAGLDGAYALGVLLARDEVRPR